MMSKFSIWDPGWSWWTSVREADKEYKLFCKHLFIPFTPQVDIPSGHHIFGQIEQDENKTVQTSNRMKLMPFNIASFSAPFSWRRQIAAEECITHGVLGPYQSKKLNISVRWRHGNFKVAKLTGLSVKQSKKLTGTSWQCWGSCY